jgi:hypothetical protein
MVLACAAGPAGCRTARTTWNLGFPVTGSGWRPSFSEVVSDDWEAVQPPVSQAYLAHVAVRAIILIDADNPVIGLVAFLAVGMDEVSSCMIGENMKPDQFVTTLPGVLDKAAV